MAGPLSGLRIVELAGVGPGPFCGMMLADHGAQVIRVERPGARVDPRDPLARSRDSIVIDMKSAGGAAIVRDLARTADGFIEGFRPGVAERLGLGPEELLLDNPKLIYGRMTGWGQTGSYAQAAGHDINYLALSGALHGMGRAGDKPTPALNLVGDFGGGAMMLAFGMLCALVAVLRGGKGQVIDCAMTDGSALLSAMTWGYYSSGEWRDERGVNLFDTGSHFYDTYECSDGKFISLAAIEPKFYALLRQKLAIEGDTRFDAQLDRRSWVPLKSTLTTLFLSRTRDEWCALLEMTDACFAPVLSLEEAPRHSYHVERGTFLQIGGGTQPAPAPRYSDTATSAPIPFGKAGDTAEKVLSEIGYGTGKIAELRRSGVVG
jgi:alpha-methylacyl-CoA racemase